MSGLWFDHDGGPRPVHPGTKVRIYRYRRFFEELEAVKLASHVQLASSVDWSNRPGEKMKYLIVGKSAEETAADQRIRDAAPELLEIVRRAAEDGENYDGDDWAMYSEEAAAALAKALGQ